MKKICNHKIISNKYILFIMITLSLIKSAYSWCNTLNCPSSRGLCNGNICVCEENYLTVNNKQIHNNGIFCNYHLKSRFVAFLLEFFFPFGVGHFYAGKSILAIIKLGLFVILISMCCSILCCVVGKPSNNTCSLILCLIAVLSIIGIIVMEIFDLVSYALGIYTDGNGVEMSF